MPAVPPTGAPRARRWYQRCACRPGSAAPPRSDIFQWASYRGDEQLEPYDKCHWNTAVGLDLAAIPGDCHLSATATTHALTTGETDPGSVYPFIRWEVELVTDGALSCRRHPLDQGLGVTTGYTHTAPERFAYSVAYADAPRLTIPGIACRGEVTGVDGVVFTPTEGGVSLSAEGSASVATSCPRASPAAPTTAAATEASHRAWMP